MNLYRPRVGVGTKTLMALTIVFWIPVAVLAMMLNSMFSDLLYEESIKQVKLQLTGAQNIIEERIGLVENMLLHQAGTTEIKQSIRSNNIQQLQASLIELGKQNNLVSILFAVDKSHRVITRRNDKRNDTVAIGETLINAFKTGEVQNSYELVPRNFLLLEDESLAKLLSNLGLVHFVVMPVKKEGNVIAALVAGIMISTDTSLGNSVYSQYGSELAIFAGNPRNALHLHATTSLPRSTWSMGQILPSEIHRIIALGHSYHDLLTVNKEEIIAAVQPIKDSNNRFIGAMGISILPDEINDVVMGIILSGVVVTAVIALFIALLSVFFVHHDITRPLAVIQDAMQRFGKGELDISLNLKTGDQLEDLGNGFNNMAENIKRREERFKKHNEVARLFMSTLNMNELLDQTLQIVVSVTNSHMGILYLWNELEQQLVPRAQYGLNQELKPLGMGDGLPGQAAKQGKQILINSSSSTDIDNIVDLGTHQLPPEEIVYIPLIYQSNLLGVLTLGKLEKYPADERQLFSYLADQISIALDNAAMHQRVQELSITDALTGLYNRRYLNQSLEQEWSRAERQQSTVSILLADIDNFKSINDEYGHDVGDEVLKKFARIFKDNARKGDVVARYGGEEFVILVVNGDHEQALKMADRICASARETKFAGLDRQVTLSIGVSSFPDLTVNSLNQLINAADQSMYKAKASGKDKVVSLKLNELN